MSDAASYIDALEETAAEFVSMANTTDIPAARDSYEEQAANLLHLARTRR